MKTKTKTITRTLWAMTLALSCLLAARPVFAQPPTTTRYIYDDNGRLRAVIAPAGEAAIYDYDPAGNITAIRRLGADGFELLSFAPQIGAVGDRVTLYGVGIGVDVNAVTFNGVAAQVVESNPIKVVAVVPMGATTGPITLSTARGTATTAAPFTVKGVSISPGNAMIFEGDRLQFAALASTANGDMSVAWSVNGVAGGNATVGTISPAGLYVAPRLAENMATATFTVRATSVAEPELSREAEVIVRNLSAVRVIAATGVSVGVPATGVATGSFVAVSRGVAVSLPVPGVPTATFAAVSRGVSVALPVAGAPTASFAAVSRGVAIGTPNAGVNTVSAAAVSRSVAVAVNLPSISTIAPARAARGATINLTINGTNLTGVTTLRFFNLSGAADATISVTNLTVAAAGNSLTATVTVNNNAATGRRLVVVATPTLPSLPVDTANTTFEVTP